MAHIINKVRLIQLSLVSTLLDLKNAFCDVHHNLIPEVLQYHHMPSHIQTIIGNLYSNFHTSIVTNPFRTPFIEVGRGVYVFASICLSVCTAMFYSTTGADLAPGSDRFIKEGGGVGAKPL